MTSIITTEHLSVEDMSELPTGDTRKENNMPNPSECAKIKDPAKRRRCMNYTGEFAVKKNPSKANPGNAPVVKKSGY